MKKNIGYLFVSLILVSGCAGLLEGGGGKTSADYTDPNKVVYDGIPSNFRAAGQFEESKSKAHATAVVSDAVADGIRNTTSASIFTGMNAAQAWQNIVYQPNGGGSGNKKAKDEDAATRAWRKEALKACVKAGTDLADCRKQVDAEQGATAETAAPQNGTASAEAPKPTTSAPATAGSAPAAPANPPAAAPGQTFTPPAPMATAPQATGYFLQFKSQVMFAGDKYQLVAALNKAAENSVSNDARAHLQDWAKKVDSGAVDWSTAKGTIVGSIDSYKALLR